MQDELIREWFEKIERRLDKMEAAIKDQMNIQRELIQEMTTISEGLAEHIKTTAHLKPVTDFFAMDELVVPDDLQGKWEEIQAGLEHDAKMKDTGQKSENVIDFDLIKKSLGGG